VLDQGAVACASGCEVARAADVVITMVPDTPHVEAALFGPNGAAEGLSPGKIVVDMSSISPMETKAFARKVNLLGCEYLDAPVSGGEVGARAASLTIMVGGPERAFATVKPLFELMGKNITLVGGNGDGQTTKVANQIIVALTIEAVGEALLFASRAGAEPARVRQALMGGFAASRIPRSARRADGDAEFRTGFRIELHQKDLNLALQGARTLGISLPNSATCQELFNAAAAGGRAWDHSAMVQVLERLACHQIGQTTSIVRPWRRRSMRTGPLTGSCPAWSSQVTAMASVRWFPPRWCATWGLSGRERLLGNDGYGFFAALGDIRITRPAVRT
jgi:2-hydroxy-3-oxopropionate reductase